MYSTNILQTTEINAYYNLLPIKAILHTLSKISKTYT